MELLAVPSRKALLAFGLDRWAILDPLASAHSQIARWKEERCILAASYRTQSDTVYGLSTTPPPPQQLVKGYRILSGAACAATHPSLKGQTALVTIEVPGVDGAPGAVAYVALERGIVTAERVVDPGQVGDLRQKFAQRFKEFKVYGVAHTIAQVDHALDLDALVPKSRSTNALAPLRSNRAVVIVAALVVAGAVLAGGYTTWSTWNGKQKQIAAQLLLRQQQPTEQYKKAVQTLMGTPVAPLGQALQSMRRQLADFPLVVGGWEFEGMSCGTSGVCSVRFKRIPGIGVTIGDFRRAAAAEWGPISAVDQDVLAFTLKLAFPQERLERGSWPAATAMRERNFEQWQFLQPGGWKAEFGPVAIQGVPAGMSQDKLASVQALPEAVYAMPLTIKDQPWWYVDDSADSPVQEALIGKNTVVSGDIELAYANRSIQFSAKALSYVVR